jgi:hypothetical protein
MTNFSWILRGSPVLAAILIAGGAVHAGIDPVDVEGQPLAANAGRLIQAFDFLGSPLPEDVRAKLQEAIEARDARKIQELLDPRVLLVVSINPESRVKVARGQASAVLQQGGYVPVLIKVVNDSTVQKSLEISSPQSGPVFAGGGARNATADKGRFLQIEMLRGAPMTANLSGLRVEYALALGYSSEAGKREATIGFNVGQGTQDLGFRGETPVLFDIRAGIPVHLSIKDENGQPTVGRFTFKDRAGHIYPPQAKRLAPDFFFQQQIYRPDGGTVLLPPGKLDMTFGHGPEYFQRSREVTIPSDGRAEIAVQLERWINPMEFGFYSGDHHIHAAGCAHYTNPTEGVFAQDMFLHVKGEGLNVGCNLTWGPCYEFQRQFFEPTANKLSEPFTVLKYDLEISGFGSQALGHVCLLNLREQTYPGSEGTKTKGWPTWTTPVMRWAKLQGGVTGYAHSANGLEVRPARSAARLLDQLDTDKDGKLSREEAEHGLLPEPFATIDSEQHNYVTVEDLTRSINRVARRLPNLAIPEMNGIGAQEICVTVEQGLCDFISAMDTDRVPEWNCWYHIMNCGFPLKASGETDFPCISGSRVGQGRVYVHLGKVDRIDFPAWCTGLGQGRSYISDGYAHALEFTVNGKTPGMEAVHLDAPGKVEVRAKVAFAKEMPLGTSVGGRVSPTATKTVELIVNGNAVASHDVPADDHIHDLAFTVDVPKSSWIALRHFPQMHTNPVDVLVAGNPIRASRKSALWCIGVIEQLWRVRASVIAADEREEAHKTFLRAIEHYRRIAAEAPAES